jgi:recombination protein RecA
VSKSLAKDGDVNYGNITKVKAIKNKMCPPYQLSQFEIVYGVGIDKLDEIMTLINDYNIGRKYGKTMTIAEHKYDLDEFKKMLIDNQEFYDEIKKEIINKIKETKTEEDEPTIED